VLKTSPGLVLSEGPRIGPESKPEGRTTRAFMNSPGYRATKSVAGEERDEHVKPLNGIQLVQIQPGQRRSGQAGSESCTCARRLAR
jgi:hypothetical protein